MLAKTRRGGRRATREYDPVRVGRLAKHNADREGEVALMILTVGGKLTRLLSTAQCLPQRKSSSLSVTVGTRTDRWMRGTCISFLRFFAATSLRQRKEILGSPKIVVRAAQVRLVKKRGGWVEDWHRAP